MSDPDLLSLLRDYSPADSIEAGIKQRFLDFVISESQCLLRSCVPGHLTGSAFVVDHSGSSVLLVHHRKLNKWLQPGGHADGDADLQRVALREVQEETGLEDLEPLQDGIFDLDVHKIPARPGEPEHLHYDVRFLFRAGPGASAHVSGESLALEWYPLEKVLEIINEESILRMVRKYTNIGSPASPGPRSLGEGGGTNF